MIIINTYIKDGKIFAYNRANPSQEASVPAFDWQGNQNRQCYTRAAKVLLREVVGIEVDNFRLSIVHGSCEFWHTNYTFIY